MQIRRNDELLCDVTWHSQIIFLPLPQTLACSPYHQNWGLGAFRSYGHFCISMTTGYGEPVLWFLSSSRKMTEYRVPARAWVMSSQGLVASFFLPRPSSRFLKAVRRLLSNNPRRWQTRLSSCSFQPSCSEPLKEQVCLWNRYVERKWCVWEAFNKRKAYFHEIVCFVHQGRMMRPLTWGGPYNQSKQVFPLQ